MQNIRVEGLRKLGLISVSRFNILDLLYVFEIKILKSVFIFKILELSGLVHLKKYNRVYNT